MAKVVKESGNEVEPYWPMLFAKALKTHKIGDLLSNLGSAGGGGGAGPAAAATGDAGKAAEAEAAEEKQESDADVEMGGLFGNVIQTVLEQGRVLLCSAFKFFLQDSDRRS